ncbi:hypothetical protein H2199_001971 [Coniosporium tulheliwenetii]|uniref:Uncharacterized protein n=1 Tax=Coniosporium tulheliwenetii TaxID=3383036 RepID=A0ACC2ZGP5_9PEZI|nr:hypothetical protein H2199_001971 [Cladosporium sp. JES 115]
MCWRREDEEQQEQEQEMGEEDECWEEDKEERNDNYNSTDNNKNDERLGIESSKRFKKRLPFNASSSISFEELQHIPQGIIQSTEVYQTFITRSNSEDENGLWLLTRLFFAIASPDTFY